MHKNIEIFSAWMNSDRQIWTRSSLAVATYKEYCAILTVLVENIQHDYPDLDHSVLLRDLSELIKKQNL